MNFYFGKGSIGKLHGLTYKLQEVARETLELGIMDFSIVCGFRGEAEQNQFFEEGKSKVQWPNSRHNKWKAEAMDLVPWINKKSSYDKRHCCVLAGLVLAVAKLKGISLRWGGNWDMDSEPITDQDFQDLVHFEEVEG